MRGTAGAALLGTLAAGGVYKTRGAHNHEVSPVAAADLKSSQAAHDESILLIRSLRASIVRQQQAEAARDAARKARIQAVIPTPYAGPLPTATPNTTPTAKSAPSTHTQIQPTNTPTPIEVSAMAGQFWFGNAESTAKVKSSGKFDNAKLAYKMAKKEPWFSIGQMACLDNLWAHESGFDEHADNPASQAGGIPQADPEEKMASAGSDWATNPVTQMAWGLHYIDIRYDTPCAAWSYHVVHNSY